MTAPGGSEHSRFQTVTREEFEQADLEAPIRASRNVDCWVKAKSAAPEQLALSRISDGCRTLLNTRFSFFRNPGSKAVPPTGQESKSAHTGPPRRSLVQLTDNDTGI